MIWTHGSKLGRGLFKPLSIVILKNDLNNGI